MFSYALITRDEELKQCVVPVTVGRIMVGFALKFYVLFLSMNESTQPLRHERDDTRAQLFLSRVWQVWI